LLLQEYPLDDLCNEVIERWKTSRANVLQEKELVKGMCHVTSYKYFILQQLIWGKDIKGHEKKN